MVIKAQPGDTRAVTCHLLPFGTWRFLFVSERIFMEVIQDGIGPSQPHKAVRCSFVVFGGSFLLTTQKPSSEEPASGSCHCQLPVSQATSLPPLGGSSITSFQGYLVHCSTKHLQKTNIREEWFTLYQCEGPVHHGGGAWWQESEAADHMTSTGQEAERDERWCSAHCLHLT